MAQKSYFEQREIACTVRTNAIIGELPYFVRDFFIGVEQNTSPLTRLNYAYDLRVFFDFLSKKIFRNKKINDIELKDLDLLTSTDIEYYLSYLSHYEINGKTERCTETGKARKLSTLRAFYKYFFNKNVITANTPTKVSMPKIHEKEIIRLESDGNKDEIGDILYCVSSGSGLTQKQLSYHNATGTRDTAIITLFLGTGIRISELVGLNINDIDLESKSFVVTRKGGSRAVLYFNDEVKSALFDYISLRKNDKKVPEEEKALFLSLQNKRISTRQVQELVKKYAKIISPLKKITPHKLRSTFGTNLYRQTGDIYAVANVLGHKDVNTTRRHYAAITEDQKKQVSIDYDLTNRKQKDDD
ncbi:MAG: tyrosine-type recombinase/integrase [Clostridia bacterium]|nr:tyrosine-type recombinase/integrase [Clostridia bacterium]